MKLKIVTIVGTRPEIIRLSRVISRLDKTTNHILIHTGQNYDHELNQIFFEDLGLKKPKYYLDAAGKNAVDTIGKIISKTDAILRKVKPDAVLILGDTNSALAAFAAKRQQIPIFHMEAGNRCFDSRVPEEINRKIVDHISDINLPYSSISREYLLREGIHPQTIIKTGSPMQEVIKYYQPKIESSEILKKLRLKQAKYFVVSAHREENVDNPDYLGSLLKSLVEIEKKYSLPVIFSTHPRTLKAFKKSYKASNYKRIRFIKPLGFTDYITLQKNALVTISDSGTINEESSILSFKAINIRDVHERPEADEEMVTISSSLGLNNLLNCVDLIINNPLQSRDTVQDYQSDDVSSKVVKIIHSKISFINQNTWKKF